MVSSEKRRVGTLKAVSAVQNQENIQKLSEKNLRRALPGSAPAAGT